jgi:hypothetical protein
LEDLLFRVAEWRGGSGVRNGIRRDSGEVGGGGHENNAKRNVMKTVQGFQLP